MRRTDVRGLQLRVQEQGDAAEKNSRRGLVLLIVMLVVVMVTWPVLVSWR